MNRRYEMVVTETEALFQLIVVGSSAGGIEALSQLVSSLPTPFAVPIVLAQHLDPNRPSHLGKILSRHSQLPVVILEDEEKLRPGTIYVVPSNNHVEITDHHVRILSDGKGRPKPSVDLLLSSASEIYGEKLIAVILTGTGSDGKLGVRAVHESGGTVVAQNPATSAYPGMAQSLDPEAVDLVADLPQIGPLLFDLVSGKAVEPASNNELELGPFLQNLYNHGGIDFRTYKPGTILRRLQRRMVATNCHDFESYKNYLETNPQEYELLVSSFLIKVTEFMRDPELFTYLQEQILPKLIEHSQENNHELRLWSAGCATGQEAYSLAILVCETLGEKIRDFNIKIFATDVDQNAVVSARRGFYPADSLDNLPKELIERYFSLERDGYSIKKRIRELIVFGEHDLSRRAPFPQIDLVLCRNVLIYFNRELQRHALGLFAFALRDSGYLVLGRTESTSLLADVFVLQEHGQKVYRRYGQRRINLPLTLENNKPLTPPLLSSKRQASSPRQPEVRNLFQLQQQEARDDRAAKDNLLLKLPIGVVVVDERFDIQEINSAARRMLSIHTAAIGEDFVHLAQYAPPRELGAAINKAIGENTINSLATLEVPQLLTGEPTFLQITCYPHPPRNSLSEDSVSSAIYALILIADISRLVKTQRELEQTSFQQTQQATELTQSVADLKVSNLELQKRNEQLQQSNVELAAAKREADEIAQRHIRQMEILVTANRNLLEANEDLTMVNADLRTDSDESLLHTEEAQAAIEEADTLNEEMQATNEELETLNEELQATIEELNIANSDLAVQTGELRQRTDELRTQEQRSEQERAQLAAILSSMDDAVMVVDLAGKVRLTNVAYDLAFDGEQKVDLLDEAGLKPLGTAETPQALAANGVAFNMTFSFRLPDGSQRWWEAVGQPVLWDGKSTLGVVVMRDVTERSLRRLQEQFLSLVGHELRTPLTVISGYLQMVESWLEKSAGDVAKPVRIIKITLVQVEQLGRLIADLVDLNRLQNGKFKLTFSEVRLDELVKQVVESSQLLTTKQVIELDSLSDGEPMLVRGDALRLQQLLFNLINNAVHHAAESPKIIVRLRRLAANQAQIQIQDYGQGIEAENLPDLFSRFYQVVHKSGVSGRGLGLGLFISQEIAEAHNGTLKVESVYGEGTTFSLQLPLL